ncbi:hypothetical protein JGH11_14090 [Dysgonomonas sp. Marseille-P4677]|uniref:hypothetical protein n=1 Tax=Dysgonomonas sp. Marseille-P4677 TaxID=2364790 RepID=UPI0019147304|nr:hypothetical protein [Dysgonomonas sp. Marseille-P4677]MBK5722005.1 hypothetical protein [Dysgonomonas sp. Marseille-P4677]
MRKVEGIIYKVFENFVVIRGYAPIGDLAFISKRPEAYQRVADEEHKRDIIRFLDRGQYTYFPEITLAYQAEDLEGLINKLHGQDDVDFEAEEYVSGLKVLKERVPWSGLQGNRARHAYIMLNRDQLTRVDGNHRLEPFRKTDWWWEFVKEDIPDGLEGEDLKKWKVSKIKPFKDRISSIVVPYSIVLSDASISDKFEASIFNNINFKALPLKQEKNIQNIYNLLRESEELGEAHDLTMNLIDLSIKGSFSGIPYLSVLDNNNDVFRTACFKIISLLIDKKEEAYKAKKKYKDLSEKNEKEKNRLETKLSNLAEQTNHEKNIKENDKIDSESKLDESSAQKELLRVDIKDIEYSIIHYRKEEKKSDNYLSLFDIKKGDIGKIQKSTNIIAEAIQSLRLFYNELEKDKLGNLSLLATLVYYKLRDKSKFKSFVNWCLLNSINNVVKLDDLPTYNSESLIEMFESFFEKKRREIFISMQFGDDQSEMIYEKVIQTIEKFNNVDKGVDIKVTPIRIDRTIAPHAYTISDEILSAIKNSSLIIADLSSRNINVYHEIGYIMGLADQRCIKPPVILLYKENTSLNKESISMDNFVGFNLRGYSQLRFRTYDELTRGLMVRLKKHFEG